MRICSGCVSDTELEKEVEFVRDPLSSWLDSKVREAMVGRQDGQCERMCNKKKPSDVS